MDVFDWILLILLSLFIAGFLLLVLYFLSFKHRYRMRKLTKGSRVLIKDTRARVKKDENGVEWWEILKDPITRKKARLPMPPDEAIEIDDKGKFIVEAYIDQHNQHHYITDTGKEHDFTGFKAFPTSQKVIMVGQFKKAQAKKRMTTHELVAMAMPYGFLIVITILVFAFWSDIMDPMKETGDKFVAASDNLVKATANIRALDEDIQIIKARVGAEERPTEVKKRDT